MEIKRSSYLHNGISYIGKMVSLYWTTAKCFLHSSTHWDQNKSNCYYADDIFKCISTNESLRIRIKCHWRFFSKGPIDNKSVLAWCAGPSLEPKMTHSTDAYKRRPVSMCQIESTVRFTKRAQYCFNTSVPSLFLNKLDRYRKWTYRKKLFRHNLSAANISNMGGGIQ